MNRLALIRQTIGKSWDDVFIRNRPLPGMSDEAITKNVYEKSDLVYICISTTARAISQVPLIVYRPEGPDNWVPVDDDDPYQALLDKPNPTLNRFSFIESMVSYTLLDGSVWVVGYPPGTMMPLSLYVVQKKYMKPVKNSANGQLMEWRYTPNNGQDFYLKEEDVSHIFLWNPYDPYDGFAPIRAGRIAVVSDYKAAIFNQKFFDQGATVGGTLATEQKLNEKVRDRLEKEIDKKYTGYEKSWKIMLLEQGLKFQQTSPSHRDMMFPELRELDKERILQIYGMKKAIISVTDDLNFATAKDQRKSWWHDTNLPIMRMIVAALNHTFFQKNNLYVDFDYSTIEALQEDYTEKIDNAKKLTEMGFTANEVNDKLELGFEEKPWRDYIFVPYSSRAVGENTDLEEEEKPEEEPPPEDDDDEDEDEKEITILPNKALSFDQRGEATWKGISKAALPIEKRFESKVRKAFFEFRQRVLIWLYQQKQKAEGFVLTRPTTEIDELSVKPFDKLKREADALYRESMMTGLKTLALDIGEALDIELLRQPEAVSFLQNKLIKLVGKDGIQVTVSKQLNKELIAGMEKGETLEQIANRVRRKFTFAATRAKTIARTEVYGSMNYSRNLGIKNSPFKKEVWYTSLDERVRASHGAMHGTKKRIDEPWIVGGATIMFPGDPSGPAGEVINCRCIVVPDIG